MGSRRRPERSLGGGRTSDASCGAGHAEKGKLVLPGSASETYALHVALSRTRIGLHRVCQALPATLRDTGCCDLR